jgi:hypothetical protein
LERTPKDLVPTCRHVARVVVFGGHERDEPRLAPILCDSPFEIRWRSFARKQGATAIKKDVTHAMKDVQAAILVIGMASHGLIQLAKRYADRKLIPYRCINKISLTQLIINLESLFPGMSYQFNSLSRVE